MRKQFVTPFTLAIFVLMQCVFMPSAYASMVSSDAIVQQQERAQNRQTVLSFLDHQKAENVLLANGVSKAEVGQRLNRLNDQELAKLAQQTDNLPAGQGVLGVVLAVILILILLDLLGVTNIFPAIHANS